MDLDLITSILGIAVFAGTSLTFATIGEVLTERSGILNLGVEGMMIMGAVTGVCRGVPLGFATGWCGGGDGGRRSYGVYPRFRHDHAASRSDCVRLGRHLGRHGFSQFPW